MAQKIHRKEEVVQYKYKNYSNRKQKKPPAKNCERFLLIQHVPKNKERKKSKANTNIQNLSLISTRTAIFFF